MPHLNMLPRKRQRRNSIPFAGLFGLLVGLGSAPDALAKRAVNTCPEVATNSSTLTLAAPVFQYTVTHFDASWFDTREPEKAPTLFIITLSPTLRQYSGTLRLHVQILADTSLGRSGGLGAGLVAMDKVTEPLDSLTSIGIPMRSNDLFALNYEPSGIDFEKSDLFNYIAEKRVVPEMNLSFRFALTCENDGNVIANAQTQIEVTQFGPTGKLRQVRTIRALTPGNDIVNVKPASIYTITPTFQLASELFNNQEFGYPPGEPKMEIFVYRVEPGQSPRDAMDGIEYAKFPVQDMNPTVYPPGQPLLEPGRTYVWRARANLRGPSLEHLWSNTLMFKIDPILGGGTPEIPQTVGDLRTFATQVKYGDDYSKRVLAALKIILAENYEVFDLSRSEKIPAKGLLRLNGQPVTLEELERLAQEFHQARHLMTRMRFQ
jgi:hypothetical protein